MTATAYDRRTSIAQLLAQAGTTCRGIVPCPKEVSRLCGSRTALETCCLREPGRLQAPAETLCVLCHRCHVVAHVEVPPCDRCGGEVLEWELVVDYITDALEEDPTLKAQDISFPPCRWCVLPEEV